jgi:UDP-N-acetylglucosamine transferase subunit ALG13
MIFVTVGTHEQQFDRLVKSVDCLIESGVIRQDVFIQTGYSSYKPRFCEYKDFIRFDEMTKRIADADLVVTHGGTGSIMMVLYNKKIPVVMPRQKKYDEHIDDHQVLFCHTLESKKKIIAAYESNDLEQVIINYDTLAQKLTPGNDGLSVNPAIFSKRLNDLCTRLVNKDK